ncbi:MAG: cupredoxin domain-containing protein [Chloroflexi bacterium]|nr:cupredoxin domain-containing protein [Chloroflexota bacterium]
MKLNTWKKALLIGVAGLLLVPLAAACGGDDDEGGSTITPGATATKDDDNGDNGDNGGEAREITVDMTDNVFTPKDIKVPVNTLIKFEADNKGTAIHNMHILSKATEGKDYASDLLVNPGESSSFEVKFTKKGVVDFQCDYHVPEMVGKIVVE